MSFKRNQLFSCEKFKVLKVIGEKVVQVVSTTTDKLCYPAAKILSIDFKLLDTKDLVFKNKVVKQGTIRKIVKFIDKEGDVRAQIIDVPIELVAEIPGVDPDLELEFQNKLINAESDFCLIEPDLLEETIVADILVKVSTFVQRDLLVCNSNVISHIQIS